MIYTDKNDLPSPVIVPRSGHTVTRKLISENALKVLRRLNSQGYTAYLAGGAVRDILLGREPKDFDVVTNATPEEVKATFRNAFLIGRRFRIAHVRFRDEIIEVSTFRALHEAESPEGEKEVLPTTEEDIKDSKRRPLEGRVHSSAGLILRDNVWGSPAEDAMRRDFTVNTLFYNLRDFSIIDYAGGLEDLKLGKLRLIGDPEERYREDPVRMLRAVRFAAKLGFTIDGPSLAPITKLKDHILSANSSRLYEELKKLWLSDEAEKGYQMMRTTGLFAVLFPETENWLDIEEGGYPHTFLGHAFQWIEDEVREGREVTVAMLFAIILCGPIMARAQSIQEKAGQKLPAIFPAVKEVISGIQSRISIPRRDTDAIKGILYGEQRFPQIRGKRPFAWVKNPHFAEAFRYFKMKNSIEGDDGELLEWWDKFLESNEPWSPPKRDLKKTGRRRRPRKRPPVKKV